MQPRPASRRLAKQPEKKFPEKKFLGSDPHRRPACTAELRLGARVCENQVEQLEAPIGLLQLHNQNLVQRSRRTVHVLLGASSARIRCACAGKRRRK